LDEIPPMKDAVDVVEKDKAGESEKQTPKKVMNEDG